MPADGILNIHKPNGLTSHDVVARVRRIVGQKRVGHAGTLDPMATGVLPVALGKATRLLEYLADAGKAYRATVMLGATTDTYDREGTIVPTPDAVMPLRERLEATLTQFRGPISQLPPMHSAVKMGGKKLYELARAGAEIERVPRPVTIYTLDLLSYDAPLLSLYVECSKGTYIRSLAYDIGAALGTGAYLDALVRTRHGPFMLDDAVSLEQLAEAVSEGKLGSILHPPEYIVKDWRFHTVTPEEALTIIQGKMLALPAPAPDDAPMLAARTTSGELLAVLYWQVEEGAWHPHKVFFPV